MRPKSTQHERRTAPYTHEDFAARTGVALEALIKVRFASTNGWVHSNGGPVWAVHFGRWTGYGIAHSETDIAWKFLRMIGAA